MNTKESQKIMCPHCNGLGFVHYALRSKVNCSLCDGIGYTIGEPVPTNQDLLTRIQNRLEGEKKNQVKPSLIGSVVNVVWKAALELAQKIVREEIMKMSCKVATGILAFPI